MLLVGDKVRIKSVPDDCTDPVEAGLVCVIECARITPDGVRYVLGYYGDDSLSLHFFLYDDWTDNQLSPVGERHILSLPTFRLGEKVIVRDDSSVYTITDIYLVHGRDVPTIGYGYRHDLTKFDNDEDWYNEDLHRWRDASC